MSNDLRTVVHLLKISNLNVYFRSANSSIKVVSGLNFEINEAEVFGLVGESGCGKSLTALSIMGILPRNAFAEGEIIFKGKNLLKLDKESMRRLRGKELSMIFQEPMTSLNPVLTVGYQVAEVLTTHKGISKREAMANTVDLLRAVKIPSPEIRIKEYPHQMSGGMRQRVMIAMAIACKPSLLIADEPTTALDVTIQAQILDLIQRLREDMKMAILLITHDLAIIAENAKRVAIMYGGRLMELADVEELFNNPRHPYTIGLLESLPKEKGTPLKPIPGFVPEPDKLPEGCKFSDRCRFTIPECMEKEPGLIQSQNVEHLVRCIRSDEIT
ncbi:MAG: peptide ABC transporter ATP-binding protein [Thermodesulfovibrio sp. RBG_19FT_COMBO_42_12]|nr:MAG: peptide ABC transporter ATP-binding protein [Thermodesulfovibrio sp. RBG_19FT_COMBO_42_12]